MELKRATSDLRQSEFGRLIKQWRTMRRLSQLELAGEASISARHLCFLETGRSMPSRDMIQHLGEALALPLAEQNALHLAAGFVPPHGERGLEAPDVGHIRQALDFILRQQEPYPALVIDGRWDIRLRNEAAARLLGPFRRDYIMPADRIDNAMHVVFHPGGLRQFMVDWEEFAGRLIQILHREVAQGSSSAGQLREEILAYPDLPASWRVPHNPAQASAVFPMRLRKGELQLAFFTTLTTFAMPLDAGLQQLKIESFYPADAATAETAQRLAASLT